jgi:hypothetical protein
VAQEQEDHPNSCSFKCTPQRHWYLRSKTYMQLWPTWSRKPGRARETQALAPRLQAAWQRVRELELTVCAASTQN